MQVPACRSCRPARISSSPFGGDNGVTEHRSHWVRDVTLDEDRPQVRTGAARQIIEALRSWTIILFMLTGEANIAAALRRHAAQSVALIGASVQ